jgi:hypothetical protein
VVADDGRVVVPTCTLETEDPDGDGLTNAGEGIHIHRRSFVRNNDGTYSRTATDYEYAS